jgi:hypothetical protein
MDTQKNNTEDQILKVLTECGAHDDEIQLILNNGKPREVSDLEGLDTETLRACGLSLLRAPSLARGIAARFQAAKTQELSGSQSGPPDWLAQAMTGMAGAVKSMAEAQATAAEAKRKKTPLEVVTELAHDPQDPSRLKAVKDAMQDEGINPNGPHVAVNTENFQVDPPATLRVWKTVKETGSPPVLAANIILVAIDRLVTKTRYFRHPIMKLALDPESPAYKLASGNTPLWRGIVGAVLDGVIGNLLQFDQVVEQIVESQKVPGAVAQIASRIRFAPQTGDPIAEKVEAIMYMPPKDVAGGADGRTEAPDEDEPKLVLAFSDPRITIQMVEAAGQWMLETRKLFRSSGSTINEANRVFAEWLDNPPLEGTDRAKQYSRVRWEMNNLAERATDRSLKTLEALILSRM